MNEGEMKLVSQTAEKVTEIYYGNDPWHVLHSLPDTARI